MKWPSASQPDRLQRGAGSDRAAAGGRSDAAEHHRLAGQHHRRPIGRRAARAAAARGGSPHHHPGARTTAASSPTTARLRSTGFPIGVLSSGRAAAEHRPGLSVDPVQQRPDSFAALRRPSRRNLGPVVLCRPSASGATAGGRRLPRPDHGPRRRRNLRQRRDGADGRDARSGLRPETVAALDLPGPQPCGGSRSTRCRSRRASNSRWRCSSAPTPPRCPKPKRFRKARRSNRSRSPTPRPTPRSIRLSMRPPAAGAAFRPTPTLRVGGSIFWWRPAVAGAPIPTGFRTRGCRARETRPRTQRRRRIRRRRTNPAPGWQRRPNRHASGDLQ